MNIKTNVAVIGGGTGIFSVLCGLKEEFKNISAIVSMADDGGSTGMLREDFGILPPGDIRRALVALSKTDNRILSSLFNYRFKQGVGLYKHNLGNLMITALERITGDFEKAIKEVSKILQVEGSVIPVTLGQAHLFAELENGLIIKGETNIDIPKHNGNLRIKRVWLKPKVPVNPSAEKAIKSADLIIFGPGDLYTSIIPNILVSGMKTAVRKSRAKKIYILNLMTKFGETNNFAASDFFSEMEKYLGRHTIDYMLVNSKIPGSARVKKYREEKAGLVRFDKENINSPVNIIRADLLRDKGFIRHDPDKIRLLIKKIAALS